MGDLLRKSRDDLLKIRNLGKKSLKEIEDRLTILGYELSPSPEPTEENPEATAESQDEEADSESDSEIEPEQEKDTDSQETE